MKASVKPVKASKSPKGKASKKSVISGKAKKPAGKSAEKFKFRAVSPAVAAEIMERLCRLYPDAQCELAYKNDFELLISVILSAQTTDANVNKVTPNLFARFPRAQDLAAAPLDEVRQLVRSTGYYNAKAQNIQACAQGIVSRFAGKVPATVEELTTLPGVGRKTANVLLGVIHNQPAWTVDTHVQRLSKRLGFSKEEDPLKIERDLQKLFAGKDWSTYSITMIWHGRRLCFARAPRCIDCPVNHLCPASTVS